MSSLHRSQETKLIQRCKKGDAEAMTIIYESFSEELLRSAILICKNFDDAQDMVSQAFILFFKSIDRFNTDYPLRPWLHRILKNEAMTLFQKRSRGFASEEELKINLNGSEPNREEEVFTAEETRYLKEAMEQLKEEERWILQSYYFQEMSIKELAISLEIPEGTIKSRLFNARASLAKKIQALMQNKP
jgi:RNA polymerase sigma-70 factor, ECF subfamily